MIPPLPLTPLEARVHDLENHKKYVGDVIRDMSHHLIFVTESLENINECLKELKDNPNDIGNFIKKYQSFSIPAKFINHRGLSQEEEWTLMKDFLYDIMYHDHIYPDKESIKEKAFEIMSLMGQTGS